MMRSTTSSGWSAATQVKAVSPEIGSSQVGQGVLCSEASIVTGVNRRVCRDVPVRTRRFSLRAWLIY